ncbi:MAG: CU044_2847 family protein [Methylomonas sp.]|jgi:hypothetical protein
MSRSIQALKFGGETIYIEVSDVDNSYVDKKRAMAKKDDMENVNALEEIVDIGQKLDGTIKALTQTVKSALAAAEPKEWSLEINLGFEGKAGIPFITQGEANCAVKVVAKWVKP